MGGYRIFDNLDWKATRAIEKYDIDKNHNGYIDDDNGELQELLSKTGAKNIQEHDTIIWPSAVAIGFGATMTVPSGLCLYADAKDYKLKKGSNGKLSLERIVPEKPYPSLFSIRNDIRKDIYLANLKRRNYFGRDINQNEIKDICRTHVKKWKFNKWMHKPFRTSLFYMGIAAASTLVGMLIPNRGVAYWDYSYDTKSQVGQQTQVQPVEQPTEHQEIKTKFEEGFKELGISEGTELKEYTPQKGEYWISILKGKYGVDDVTAQKMANKIKDIVYDDPKASKQTPIMYLPQTWTFEGKTYKYNENATVAKTDDYSDDVKTEMGKMSKDIKYE